VGKTIVQKTLDTKDPAEAKRRFLPVATAIDREWTRLAAAEEITPPRERDRLKPKQVLGIAGEFYRWMVSKHDGDPGKAEKWREEVEKDRRFIVPPQTKLKGLNWVTGGPGRYMPLVQQFLEERGILVPEDNLFDIAAQAAWAGMRAKERLARIAEKDYSDDPAEARYPKWDEVKPTLAIKSEMLTVADHYDEFANTRSAGLRKKYRTSLQDLARFLGHENLAIATPENIQAWVDDLVGRMVGEGKEARRKHGDKDIADGYLTAARSFYKWAVSKRKLKANPAADIRHEYKAKPRTRPPYFTDEESKLILSEALREPSGRESPEFRAAKRWAPWLYAYPGARVNEITQLRKQDVRRRRYEDEDVWTINITPEAGPVKNGRAREIPLHEHLIAQGFPGFVEGCETERLFYDPARRRGGSDKNPTSAKVGAKIAEWVRKLGVPKSVAPNHGWRHRFKAVARRKRMIPEIRDAMNGHKARTEGEAYGGDVEWDMMWPEVKLLPRIEVEPAMGPLPHTEARAQATKTRAAQRKRAKARGKAPAMAAE